MGGGAANSSNNNCGVNNAVCWRPVFVNFPVCVFVLLRGVEKEAHTQNGLGKTPRRSCRNRVSLDGFTFRPGICLFQILRNFALALADNVRFIIMEGGRRLKASNTPLMRRELVHFSSA